MIDYDTEDWEFVSGGEEEIIAGPMTAEELEELRKYHGEDYQPEAPIDPLQNDMNDDKLVLMSPFFSFDEPPTFAQVESIMANHPARVARTTINMHGYYDTTLAYLFTYCLDKANKLGDERWLPLAQEILDRCPDNKLMQHLDAEKRMLETRRQIAETTTSTV